MNRSSRRSRAFSGILFGFIITFVVNISLRAQVPQSPGTVGEQKTLVMLVNFQNDPADRPWTFDQVRSAFGAASDFFKENSYQQTWLSTDVVGWYILPINSSTCDVLGIKSYANSAATAAGVNLSAYAHHVYLFPAANCSFDGAASVGGNPSQAYINGDLTLRNLAHELGHNLGNQHAHSLVCNDTGDASGTATGPYCFILEYGDGLDTMGWSYEGAHYNAFMKEHLGWLNQGVSPPITTVQTSGTYVLDTFESTGTNPKALKIFKGTDPLYGMQEFYYVEYRQPIGFDGYLATISPLELNGSNILNGVLIHKGYPASPNTSELLDMTPETYQLYTRDPALDVGMTFSDPVAGVTITTKWVNSASAGVSVTLSQPCARANPSITLSPSSQSAQPGAAAAYTVSVVNNDGANCGPSSFRLQANAPAGWTAALSASTLTISPGATASATVAVTSPVGAAASIYSVGVTAANGTYTATATASYSVLLSLVTSVSTDQSNYVPGSTVYISDVTTTSGGTPLANAAVTITITKPNGAVVTQSAKSDGVGTVKTSLKLNKQKDPAGTYQILATATINGASAKSNKNFTVQ